MYLLDTDVLTEFVKPAPPADLLDRLSTIPERDFSRIPGLQIENWLRRR